MSNTKKFHPILFSTPMVQAILEGIKTQTRRTKGLEGVNEQPDLLEYSGIRLTANFPPKKTDFKVFHYFQTKESGFKEFVKCPYELDDVLWVRETFTVIKSIETGLSYILPKASFESYKDKLIQGEKVKWKPSIFMPKEACRIFLKIKSIRTERLNEISEDDSIAEGAVQYEKETDWMSAKYGFQMIWEDINGKESWKQNPFVWVYEFERIEKPLDFI